MFWNVLILLLSQSNYFALKQGAVVVPDKASLNKSLAQLKLDVLLADRYQELKGSICLNFPDQSQIHVKQFNVEVHADSNVLGLYLRDTVAIRICA